MRCILISQGKEHLLLLSLLCYLKVPYRLSQKISGKMEREVTQVVAIERWITQKLAYYLPNKLHKIFQVAKAHCRCLSW